MNREIKYLSIKTWPAWVGGYTIGRPCVVKLNIPRKRKLDNFGKIDKIILLKVTLLKFIYKIRK